MKPSGKLSPQEQLVYNAFLTGVPMKPAAIAEWLALHGYEERKRRPKTLAAVIHRLKAWGMITDERRTAENERANQAR